MSDYTPTTDEVRTLYAMGRTNAIVTPRREEFDRWLRDHDAEVLKRAARALQNDDTAEPGSRKSLHHGIYARWLEDRALKIAEGKLTDV